MNSDYEYEYDYEEIDTTSYTTSTEPSTTTVYTTKGFKYILTVLQGPARHRYFRISESKIF